MRMQPGEGLGPPDVVSRDETRRPCWRVAFVDMRQMLAWRFIVVASSREEAIEKTRTIQPAAYVVDVAKMHGPEEGHPEGNVENLRRGRNAKRAEGV